MRSKKNLSHSSQNLSSQRASTQQRAQYVRRSPLVSVKWRKFCTAIAQTALLAIPSLLWLEPTTAQPANPFLCGNDLYLMQDSNAALFNINRTALPYTLQAIGGASGIAYNALGFNPVDGFLYAIDSGGSGALYRIDNTGAVTSLGVPAGWDNTWGDFWFSGTFLEDGTYVVNRSVNGTTRIVRINVQTPAVLGNTILNNTFNTIFDIAVNPLDGQIYAYNEANGGRLLRIDPTTFAITEVSTVGQAGVIGRVAATFFDSFGRLFLYGSPSGDITNFTRFFVADTATGVISQISNSTAVVRSDGAACTFGVAIEKTVSPGTTTLGSTVTYSYRITNQSDVPVTTTFVDDMDTNGNLGTVDADERSYVASTLTNPFGGTPNGFGGSEQLSISGMIIPANTTNTITVNVAIPNAPGLDGRTLPNQACLNNTTSASAVNYPPSFCSDDDDFLLFPNTTPLIIAGAAPAVSGYKSVQLTTDTGISGATSGDTLTWRITYANTGTVDVPNFQISDVLPPNVTLLGTLGAGNITVNAIQAGGTTPTANAGYTGAGNNNLFASGFTLRSGGVVTVDISTTINPGLPNGAILSNQPTGTSPDLPAAGVRTDNIDNTTAGLPAGVTALPNSVPQAQTGAISPTTLTGIGVDPRLLLVKRITAINGDTTGFAAVQDDPNDPNDTNANWPNGFLVGGTTATASSGDVVDYTIYFLNAGNATAGNVKICDPLSTLLTYIPNSYDGSTPTDGGGTSNLGIELNFGGSSVFLTGANDAPDRGQLVAAGVAPTGCVIQDPNNAGAIIPMTAANNNNGTLVVDLTTVDNATGTGAPNTAYGYVRFRATVN